MVAEVGRKDAIPFGLPGFTAMFSIFGVAVREVTGAVFLAGSINV